jgi:hypothetical protein
VKEIYTPYLFRDAKRLIVENTDRPALLLRHDIDLDVDKALSLAEIESKIGIFSCYMFMSDCPFYSLNEKHTQRVILKIKEMGHEIGLHYDSNSQLKKVTSNQDFFRESIEHEAKKLESIIECRVESISFHRPIKKYINGPFYIGDRINAYSKELMGWYLSDSKGNWRDGDPMLRIKSPQGPILQLLTHPIWWGERHLIVPEKLQEFFDNKTKGLSEIDIGIFDNELSKHLTVVRGGKK